MVTQQKMETFPLRKRLATKTCPKAGDLGIRLENHHTAYMPWGKNLLESK
jgi:hypothetical protein